MPFAWTCKAFPEQHGTFPQKGLEIVAAVAPELQPVGRFGCVLCIMEGKPAWVRPATITEAERLSAQQEA